MKKDEIVVLYKICKSCGEEKSIDNFHKSGTTPKGTMKYKANCKKCTNILSKKITKKCERCNNTFKTSHKSARFCSVKCSTSEVCGSDRFEVKCEECGIKILKTQYQIARSKHHYCSKNCKRKGQINTTITNEEREIKRNFPAYINWRKSIYERDDYTCVCCSKIGGKLNAHHLDGFSWCKERRTDIDNGVTLCEDCHKEFHCQYGNRNNTKEQFEEFMNLKYRQVS